MDNLNYFKDKTILITGGTGSFGQAFVDRLLAMGECKKIIIFSRDEFKQHVMCQRLVDAQGILRFFIGDVRDQSRLYRAFSGVDIVVHAAALKQVPTLEYNPSEAIKTNIIGTHNVIEAVLDKRVKKAVLISSDKAVNPINLYGATKLCAEKLWIAANALRHDNSIAFSAVRYGNVVGSRGSIVEVLNEQKKTGVVTLTHPDMTRFFITINQGVDLVMSAIAKMKAGEIFVPKLKTMKISALLRRLAPDCEIRVTGIRPGEKIHEILMTEDEVRRAKDANKFYIIQPQHDWWNSSHIDHFESVPADFRYSSDNAPTIDEDEFSGLFKE